MNARRPTRRPATSAPGAPSKGTPRQARRAAPIAAVLATGLVLAACGSAASPADTKPAAAAAANSSTAVTTVDSSVTAQMLAAAPATASHRDEATFTLTAHTAAGKTAAGQPVTFWIGPMVPESGVHPAHWYRSGTQAAAPYIASFTSTTNAAGQATLLLLGQPAQTMEMVAVKIGDLTSFDSAAGHGLGLLDAWWTTASSTPTAPVGDQVQLSPFLAATRPGQSTLFRVRVTTAAGTPVAGAGVMFIPQKPAGSRNAGPSISGSSPMATSPTPAASPGMTASGMTPVAKQTDAAGVTTYLFTRPATGTACPLRVVVTQPSSTARIAGGMAGELVTLG